ncbi:MAG: hypothetical protein R2710_18125 [Acidimicrobiales bacterium]
MRSVTGSTPERLRWGGAVALVGDDPNAKSSTIPSSSAGVVADMHMPLLYPGDPAEVLDLGRHAIALSRFSGLWSAIKIVADVADGMTSVDLAPDRVQPIAPDGFDEATAVDRWPVAHAVHRRTRAGDLRRPVPAGRELCLQERPQSDHRRPERCVDRHRSIGHHVPRGA